MLLKSLLFLTTTAMALAAPLTFEGSDGPGNGKHIVFIANDHEYRSEETCPLIAKILAKHHGFKCTVLFGLDENGHIKGGGTPIPHIDILKDADLLFFYTRFMKLPDEQVDALVDYYERGGPTIGLRTSTHCFNGQKGKWAKLNFNYEGDDYLGGLGEQIYGNTWHHDRGQGHYGQNHKKGARLSPIPGTSHPILTGVSPMHAYSGAYISQPPAGSTPLLNVQVLKTFGPGDELEEGKETVNAGWTRDHYVAPSGAKKDARVVYTSFGASEDLADENARRFLVNSTFWALGLEDSIKPDLNVSFVGGYNPSPYTTGAFFRLNVKPSDLTGWDSSVMPVGSKLSGLDTNNKKMKSRIYSVLSPRPAIVEQIKKSDPDFNLEDYKPTPAKK
ncbi:MAG: ThuA domain-containing protein [Verrucomicrobiaceae bacterium]